MNIRTALEQVLDDAGYLKDDGTYLTPDEKPRGGCICAAAAGWCIEALASLPSREDIRNALRDVNICLKHPTYYIDNKCLQTIRTLLQSLLDEGE